MSSVLLDIKRLKLARERRKLSVKEVVAKAFGNGGTKSGSLSSQIRMYQKIEQTGHTSLDRANRIEEALGMAQGSLHQGADIAAAESNLAERIRNRVRELHASDDLVRIEELAKLFGMKASELVAAEDWEWRDLAGDLSKQLAIASLWGENEKLQELGGMVGLSEKDIGCPLLGESLWWLSSNEWGREPGLGKLLLSLTSLSREIERLWDEELPTFFRCEAATREVRASLVRHDKHFRLVICGDHNTQCSFEFCVCNASRERGIQWKEADEWDEEGVRMYIGDLIAERADVVSLFGQTSVPANAEYGFHISFYKINLEEWFPSWNPNPLCQKTWKWDWDLRTSLQVFLRSKPAECWSMELEGHGVIFKLRAENLDGNHRFPEFLAKVSFLHGYFDAAGQFQRAPWPIARRKQFIDNCQQSRRAPIIVPDENFIIPEFAPEDFLKDGSMQ